jgi:hypothetical protein
MRTRKESANPNTCAGHAHHRWPKAQTATHAVADFGASMPATTPMPVSEDHQHPPTINDQTPPVMLSMPVIGTSSHPDQIVPQTLEHFPTQIRSRRSDRAHKHLDDFHSRAQVRSCPQTLGRFSLHHRPGPRSNRALSVLQSQHHTVTQERRSDFRSEGPMVLKNTWMILVPAPSPSCRLSVTPSHTGTER